MKGLLIVERFIIESLNKRAKNLIELKNDTGLNREIILNIVSNLSMKGIIIYRDSRYSLNLDKKDSWLSLINEKGSQCEEVKELLVSLVNNYFKEEDTRRADIKLKKIYLDPVDETVIKTMFLKIEEYISSVSKKNVGKTKEQKVLIWGHGSYGDIMNQFMSLA